MYRCRGGVGLHAKMHLKYANKSKKSTQNSIYTQYLHVTNYKNIRTSDVL